MMRRYLWAALLASVLANAFLAYKLFDTVVSLDYARAQTKNLTEQVQSQVQILKLDWQGRPVTEIATLRQALLRLGVAVKRDGDNLNVGDLEFRVRDGRVQAVELDH